MGDALRAPWLAAAAVALLEGKQPKVVSGRVQVHSVSPAAGRIVVADRTTCADAYLENATEEDFEDLVGSVVVLRDLSFQRRLKVGTGSFRRYELVLVVSSIKRLGGGGGAPQGGATRLANHPDVVKQFEALADDAHAEALVLARVPLYRFEFVGPLGAFRDGDLEAVLARLAAERSARDAEEEHIDDAAQAGESQFASFLGSYHADTFGRTQLIDAVDGLEASDEESGSSQAKCGENGDLQAKGAVFSDDVAEDSESDISDRDKQLAVEKSPAGAAHAAESSVPYFVDPDGSRPLAVGTRITVEDDEIMLGTQQPLELDVESSSSESESSASALEQPRGSASLGDESRALNNGSAVTSVPETQFSLGGFSASHASSQSPALLESDCETASDTSGRKESAKDVPVSHSPRIVVATGEASTAALEDVPSSPTSSSAFSIEEFTQEPQLGPIAVKRKREPTQMARKRIALQMDMCLGKRAAPKLFGLLSCVHRTTISSLLHPAERADEDSDQWSSEDDSKFGVGSAAMNRAWTIHDEDLEDASGTLSGTARVAPSGV